jgi:hypothetical protein
MLPAALTKTGADIRTVVGMARAFRPLMEALARLCGGPVHPGKWVKHGLILPQEFGIKGAAGIKGARPVFRQPEFVGRFIFDRMGEWAHGRGLRNERHTGAWECPFPKESCPAPLWTPSYIDGRLMLSAAAGTSMHPPSQSAASSGNVALQPLDGTEVSIGSSASVVAPVARPRPGEGWQQHASKGRETWAYEHNAVPYDKNGNKRHRIKLPLDKSTHFVGTRRQWEYIPLRCLDCNAAGVYRARHLFAAPVCGDTEPYVHPRMRQATVAAD